MGVESMGGMTDVSEDMLGMLSGDVLGEVLQPGDLP